MSEDEVMESVREGKASGCSEALITLGERPEFHSEAKNKLLDMGFETAVDYVEYLCEKILDYGLLPHTNAGLLDVEELERLRRFNASMGLMLENTAKLDAHAKSPGKNPKLRLEMIELAGKLEIPYTTGLLVGIGETEADRFQSLVEIRKLSERYGHIQEIIIQPFVPKSGTPMENRSPPTKLELLSTVKAAKELIPQVSIQIPVNLVENLEDFLRVGVDDLGGISTITPDFVNPDNPWPEISKLKSNLRELGYHLRERLPIYPRFIEKPDFMSSRVRKAVEDFPVKQGFRAP